MGFLCLKIACLRASIGTYIWVSLQIMSHSKAVPDDMKPEECKRNVGWSKPPILYIPEKDVIQKELDRSANTHRLTLPYKLESHVSVC